MSAVQRLRDWLDARTGVVGGFRCLGDQPVPEGPRWSRSFGGALLILLLIQLGSGLTLALHYSPSITSAWESVWFIEHRVAMGSFIRALHHHGASLLVIAMLLHGLRVILYGAYRRPRELTWWTGLLLFVLMLVFALTGYLLPWDERGFGATRVATGLIALTPGVGESLRRIVLGGEDYGHQTLTRFYAIHVVLLPGLLLALLTFHLRSRLKAGLAPPTGEPSHADPAEEAPKPASAPWWPGQGVRMLAVAAALVAVLAAFARSHPAPLTAPADAATAFPARPEWYFLPLFQLLKTPLFSGSREVLGSHGLPALLLLGLALLPWLDRDAERARRNRKGVLAITAVVLIGAVLLALQALQQDADDPTYRNHVKLGEERARVALELAEKGIPVEGARVMMQRSAWHGEQIFHARCAGCHRGDSREATFIGPGFLSVEHVARFIRRPSHVDFFGLTPLGKQELMMPYDLPEETLRDLARYVLQEGSVEQLVRAEAAWKSQDCADCHERKEGLAGGGPNLWRYGGPEWLELTIRRPHSLLRYGKESRMPAFDDELGPDDMTALLAFLKQLREQPVPETLGRKGKVQGRPKALRKDKSDKSDKAGDSG